ncbi:hypothetical protein LX64_04870 [Chitinophaga skermanii]|uniref:Uncharacterized protein n=1 Tax=Chitinophaga skermanii TaxID=331697 RepID=A0A327Q257_9BACT|nr:hypothetical protein LX64_04870 [Chitinophaga skermanii]
MGQEYSNSRGGNRYRPLGELIRGLFFVGFALMFVFAEQLGINLSWSMNVRYAIGAVLGLYGLFRIYRGITGILSKDERA